MVLVHGLPGRWQEFLPMIPCLSMQSHIYALDFRGQGKSGRTPGEYQSKYYTADLISFLDKLPNQPATLFGLSAGGAVTLCAAAQRPDLVRAVIVGDFPLDLDELVKWMTSKAFVTHFSALRMLASKDLSMAELETGIANIQVRVPGKGTTINYGDTPGIDLVRIQQLALTLRDMDPGVLEYHAEGRPIEFLVDFNLERMLPQITCPVLLLQANPSLGGMLTDKAVSRFQAALPNSSHLRIDQFGHDLGLGSWDIGPMLRAVMNFMQVI